MSKKILLIRGGSVLSKGRLASISIGPPLGIAYLAACLRKENYNVSILDAAGEDLNKITSMRHFDLLGLTNEEILERFPSDIDMVCFSSMFSNEWMYLKNLIKSVKKRFPQTVTVLGGEHASALPEYSLQSCDELDYVMSGEGEHSIVQLTKCLFENLGERSTVSGLSYRSSFGVQTNPKVNRIKAVDEIPFPAWDLTPLENYLREGKASIFRMGHRIVPILASRGCPYECKFCSNPAMYGNRYFVRDVEEVIREIKFLIQHYRITGFEFHDLTFITKKSWVKQFCRRLIEENMEIEWTVPTTRSEAIDEEVVTLLKKSGCKVLFLTPDSGSPRMIEEMLKKVNLKKMTQTARIILKNGLILRMNIVFGFPGERHVDVWRSILYGFKLAFFGVDSIIFLRFVPYPGSAYFEQLLKEGKLPPLGPEFDHFLVLNIYNELSLIHSYSEHLSDRAVRIYMFIGLISTHMVFYLCRPWQILFTLKRLIQRSPVTTIDFLIFALISKKFRLLMKLIKTITGAPMLRRLSW